MRTDHLHRQSDGLYRHQGGGHYRPDTRFSRTLFIFIAHEDGKGEPQGSPAVRAKQMAHAIFHVKGLAAFATVRGTGGERIDIDKDTADLVHGERKLTIDS